jgi:thioredoxin-dependent peroxiredoxin
MLKVGSKAPDFILSDAEGKKVSLSDFKGKKIVLYFYPKDDTPGCTKEACSFRDVYDRILAKGAVVIGISADNAESHKNFKKKYNLPFHLLSDEEHKIIETYGAWGDKSFQGKISKGIIRSTYIIDEKGVILEVFPKVTPDNHAAEVMEAL